MRQKTNDHKFYLALLRDNISPSQMVLNDSRIISFLSRHKLFADCKNLNGTSLIKRESLLHVIKDQTVRSMLLSQVLINILKKLKQRDIEVIPLKGPVLASTLYGDVGKRHFGDLDLMVQREDVVKVIEILGRIGYKQIHPRTDLSKIQWDYYFKWKKDIGLVKRELRVFTELHTGIYYHELLNQKKQGLFFEDLAEETLAGTTVRCMNRDNTFLYLSYHGAQHMYFRLFWLRDVAEALKKWKLDHSKILKNTHELGIERLLGVSLELAREFFDAVIPEEYIDLLESNAAIIKKLKNLCVKRILGPEELTFIGKLRKHYYIMSLKPGIKYKWVAFQSIFHRWYIRKFLGGD